MSRRRQRSAAYRARRAVRQRYVPVTVSHIVTVTFGPLTAREWPLDAACLEHGLLRREAAPTNLTELSTREEVDAFFADNVTQGTYSSRHPVR